MRPLVFAAVGAALALPVSAHAADTAFIKFPTPDLAGDAPADKELKGAIEAREFWWTLNGARPSQAPSLTGFGFAKSVDRASPGLMVAAADGRVIPWVRVVLRRPGATTPAPATYFEYCLENVTVKGISARKGADVPYENLEMNVGRFSQRYIPNPVSAPSGSSTPVSAAWDFQQNTLGTMPARCGD
jgi:type VI protein secretion system component Hcp